MGILDTGDLLNGDQDTLSYRNEWAILTLVTSINNDDIIFDEKFKGDYLIIIKTGDHNN